MPEPEAGRMITLTSMTSRAGVSPGCGPADDGCSDTDPDPDARTLMYHSPEQ